MGTIAGPVIGGAFLVVVKERLAANLTDVHQVIFGVPFILVVLLLPGGLMEIWDRLLRGISRRRDKRLQASGRSPDGDEPGG